MPVGCRFRQYWDWCCVLATLMPWGAHANPEGTQKVQHSWVRGSAQHGIPASKRPQEHSGVTIAPNLGSRCLLTENSMPDPSPEGLQISPCWDRAVLNAKGTHKKLCFIGHPQQNPSRGNADGGHGACSHLAHLSHGHGLHRLLVLHRSLQTLLPKDLVGLIGEEHGVPIEGHAQLGAGGLHLLLEDQRCRDPCGMEQGGFGVGTKEPLCPGGTLCRAAPLHASTAPSNTTNVSRKGTVVGLSKQRGFPWGLSRPFQGQIFGRAQDSAADQGLDGHSGLLGELLGC